jgi:aromatic-L-amino-acid decarboxylase
VSGAAPWPLEPGPAERAALEAAVLGFVRDALEGLESAPSFDLDGVEAVARALEEPPPEAGTGIAAILERLAPAVAKSYTTPGPGYLAYIPGGGIYSAALADFLACVVNRYTGVRQAAPALVRLEEVAIGWLARLVGYPETAGGILTSGGSLSNLAAIVAARESRLADELARGVLYVSAETHHSVEKAARIAGLRAGQVRSVAVDERFRMRPDALAEAIRADEAAGRRPFMVVPTAGTTNTGAVDPLTEIVAISRRHGLWVHCDAAYGGFFRLVPGGERLIPALEECDSITLDPHKGLFLPYGTGCLLVREPDALRRAHELGAAYLQDVSALSGASFADLTPELSRDFRGLRLWLPLKLHGVAAFRDALAEKLALTREAHATLAAHPDLFEILDPPQLSVVAFALRGTDAAGAELLRRVNARRRVFLSSTRLRGRYALRICVLCFRTHADRVREAVAALVEEARTLVRAGA